MSGPATLWWTIDQPGTGATEGAALEFYIRHTAGTSGLKLVNHSITCSDAENNRASFPAPAVQVDCGVTTDPGIILTEVDPQGKEYPRGTKTVTVPARHRSSCRDILVEHIRFVLPEDLNVSGNPCCGLCSARTFRARVIAHSMDSDFICFDSRP